ncbi:tetratricopeptide repeat protein [Cellvibrio sp. OA-2007]|uniref:tetratricopeptide repeat protein n=1 Tax=Cellvibrio sp. OA-2007 TaxID=529823 RepID=UPI000AD10314|nr:tetratricopeptide repeat protein [Cellvibrio sp. OA-2007]
MIALIFLFRLCKNYGSVIKWLVQLSVSCGLILGALVAHAGLFTLEPSSAFTDQGVSPVPSIELKNRIGSEAFENVIVDPGKSGLEQLSQVAQAAIKKYPKSGLAHEVLGTVLFYSHDLDGALTEFKQAAQLDPEQDGPWTKLGIVQMELEQVDAAESSLKKALELKPLNRVANQRLGLLYEFQKKDVQAIQYLKKGLIDTGNQYLGVAPNLAQLLNRQNSYVEAIEYLAPRAPLSLADASVQSILATSYLGAGEYANANQRFMRALELQPDTREYLLGLAISQRKNKEFDAAETTLKKLASKFPNWGSVYIELGDLALASGRLAEAEAAFATAVAKGARRASIDYKFANYYLEKKQPEEAIKRLRGGIAAGQAQPRTYTMLAELERAQNNLDAGLATLLDGTKKFPKNGLLQFRLGSELAALRRYEEALPYLARANQLHPLTPDILRAYSLVQSKLGKTAEAALTAKQLYLARGEQTPEALLYATLLQQDKQYSEAELTYKKILATESDNVVALNNLAALFAEQGKLDEAEKNARKANQLLPENAQLMDTLGWVLYQQKHYREASELLAQAAKIAPSSAIIHYHAGVIFTATGKQSAAKVFLEKALELDTKSYWVADAQKRLERL